MPGHVSEKDRENSSLIDSSLTHSVLESQAGLSQPVFDQLFKQVLLEYLQLVMPDESSKSALDNDSLQVYRKLFAKEGMNDGSQTTERNKTIELSGSVQRSQQKSRTKLMNMALFPSQQAAGGSNTKSRDLTAVMHLTEEEYTHRRLDALRLREDHRFQHPGRGKRSPGVGGTMARPQVDEDDEDKVTKGSTKQKSTQSTLARKKVRPEVDWTDASSSCASEQEGFYTDDVVTATTTRLPGNSRMSASLEIEPSSHSELQLKNSFEAIQRQINVLNSKTMRVKRHILRKLEKISADYQIFLEHIRGKEVWLAHFPDEDFNS